MSKILIVPDVHGRKFWHEAEELINEVDKVVFLGDYLDPYGYEGITFEDAVMEFENILAFKEDYPDKVVLLLGNHDMHYLISEFMNCSRLNAWRRVEIHDIFMNNIDKFQLIYEFEDYLFSHSGLYKEWMDKHELSLDDLKDYKTFLRNRWEILQDIGRERGGWDRVGSCIWADIRESIDNELYSDKRQIVGHTQLSNDPYITSKIACLDVRQCFILDTEKDEIIGTDA
jgi:predicted phosphodiesterase